MLSQISIQHFAIVDTLNLSFKNGMTVITGETGAGKSIIIDALNLLLGKPASDTLIKVGFETAWVEATFTIKKPKQYPELLNYQNPDSPTEFTFFRQISRNKINRVRINGQTVTLRQLKTSLSPLLYIVSQHQSITFLDPTIQLQLIDNLASLKATPEHTDFKQKFTRYNDLKKILETGKTGHPQLQQERDFIQFQLNDLTPHHFTTDEEDHLKDHRQKFKTQRNALKQLNKIQEKLTQTHALLMELTHDMSQTPTIAPTEILNYISNGVDQLETPLNWCQSEYHTYNNLPDLTIDDIESRLDLIFRYKTKYHVTHTRDLVSKVNELTQRDIELTDLIENNEKRQEKQQQYLQECLQSAKKLHTIRQNTATQLSQQLSKDCLNLQFSHCDLQFNVIFDETVLSQNGANRIEWLISTNKGIPVGPISQVASGGELSRLMLAIESNTARYTPNLTIIFDEVDTGIGGLTAHSIGNYLSKIAHHKQVVCITHLPQIAQLATHHLTVEKYETDTSTTIKVTSLTDIEKPQEIKRMVGGEAITRILHN